MSKDEINHDQETTEEDAERLRGEVVHAQEQVSEAVLKSELGWEVIDRLAQQCIELHLSTRGFTTMVVSSMSRLETQLKDPEGFRKSFHTLIRDLGEFHEVILETSKKHQGRTGRPTEEELPEVMELSLTYSKVIDYFEMAVRPLWIQLLETIQQETQEEVSVDGK